MLLTERVAQVTDAEFRIERLSARVQGKMLLGQERDVKALVIALAREAQRVAAAFSTTGAQASPDCSR